MDSEFNVQSSVTAALKSAATRPQENLKREEPTTINARQEQLYAQKVEDKQRATDVNKSQNKDDAQQQAIERKQAEEAAHEVSEFLNASKRGLEFSVDEKAGRTIVKVMDIKEEKVIRQIPTEEVLQLAQRVRELKEELSGKTGMLFESKV